MREKGDLKYNGKRRLFRISGEKGATGIFSLHLTVIYGEQ
jgi:hypothetical protein